MNINVSKAFQFIENNGNKFQKAYSKCLFGKKNLTEVIEYLSEYQNEDGGWYKIDPDYVGSVSSITCTMLGFAKYERLNITDDEGLNRAIQYLRKVQKTSGIWDEPIEILKYNIPSWYYPRSINNQIWFTNGMARYIVSRKAEETQLLEKARTFLHKHWDGSKFPGYAHNDWMGIVTFFNTGVAAYQEIWEGCMNNLSENISKYDIADVAWALESLVFLKIPKSDKTVSQAIDILKNSQCEDGGFKTEYGSSQRVDVTIEAIDSLASYGEFPRMYDF